jgi:hypothetical protein
MYQLDQVFNDLAKSDNFRVEYFDETEEEEFLDENL